MTSNLSINAAAAGSFALGGDLPVRRLGFGAMQLPGPDVWGRRATTPARCVCCAAQSSWA